MQFPEHKVLMMAVITSFHDHFGAKNSVLDVCIAEIWTKDIEQKSTIYSTWNVQKIFYTSLNKKREYLAIHLTIFHKTNTI